MDGGGGGGRSGDEVGLGASVGGAQVHQVSATPGRFAEGAVAVLALLRPLADALRQFSMFR